MCGIHFHVSKTQTKLPEWLPHRTSDSNGFSTFKDYASVELSEQDITRLMVEDLACDTHLTKDDEHKLASVERLRDLQQQWNLYKNGQHRAYNKERLDSIEREMASLTVNGCLIDGSEYVAREYKGPVDSMRAVLARGPDYARFIEFSLNQSYIHLFSSVLLLRKPFTNQPLVREEWILQFNGELYNSECFYKNDTFFIIDLLSHELQSGKDRSQAVKRVISGLDGEFAYVLLDTVEVKVYFGKDSVGKRSLLFESTPEGLSVSSIFPSTAVNATECKGNVIYEADLVTYEVSSLPLRNTIYRPTPASLYSVDDKLEESCLLQLHQNIQEACEKRQSTIHPLHPHSTDVRLGILFSGGLDCTVLAAVIAQNFANRNEKCLIDLLTVGFDNPRTGLFASSSPDRILSQRSWFELAKLFQHSGVEFRLSQIDVTYAEWLAHRHRARELIYPCATEMDLSIAIAFYFATRAENCELLLMNYGDFQDVSWTDFKDNQEEYVRKIRAYTSRAKVLFSGLGADELFGGYSRHENIFNGLAEDAPGADIYEKYDVLARSLMHDIDAIYARNLGRDDRVMSAWGKELRYPYLDESFMKWVVEEISPQLKVRFQWQVQESKKGEKRVMNIERKYILRRLAQKLGLEMVSRERKRAIQFGAKSAKMEIRQHKTRGTDAL